MRRTKVVPGSVYDVSQHPWLFACGSAEGISAVKMLSVSCFVQSAELVEQLEVSQYSRAHLCLVVVASLLASVYF